MESTYGSVTSTAEAKRLYVQRNYYKRGGLEVEPARLKLTHLVLTTCRALLRQLSPDEEREVLSYMLHHPTPGRKRSTRLVRRR